MYRPDTHALRFRWTRIADYVADVAQVVSQFPEVPVLVGHSTGGLVVQKYLEEYTVPAAVLLASVPVKGVFRTTLRIALRHPWAFLKANLTWSLYPLISTPNLTREDFFSMDISSDKLNSPHPETSVLDARYQSSAFGFQQRALKTMCWLIAVR